MRLDEITMEEFIAIASGESSCSEEEARKLVDEYRSIADPQGLKRHIIRSERLMKARSYVTFFTMCLNILNVGDTQRTRKLLGAIHISLDRADDERVRLEVESRLERAKAEVKKYTDEREESTPDEIRKGFDTLTACLMAHFRFQIDIYKIRAGEYANLVAIFDRSMQQTERTMKQAKY